MEPIYRALFIMALYLFLGISLSATSPKFKTPNGKEIPIVKVLELNTNPKKYEGEIAIDGKVSKIYEEKGCLVLTAYGKNICEDEHCPGCKADQELPIRYDKAKVEGKLPIKGDCIYAIAAVKTNSSGGFVVSLREVYKGNKLLFKIKK